MKGVVLLTIMTLGVALLAEELVLFDQGKLQGTLRSKAEIRDGKLWYRTQDEVKLKLAPAKSDLTDYQFLEVVFTPNRIGDQFRFTVTSNPPGATKWNYFYGPIQTISSKDKQTIIVELNKLGRSREPMGMNKVQTLDFNFTGWDMKYRKGLQLVIERIVLKSDKNKKDAILKAEEQRFWQQIAEQIKLLPKEPWIPVPDASDRKFWDSKRNTLFAKNMLKYAEHALKTPAAAPSTDAYLDFLRNGNRTRYEQAYIPVMQNFSNLTMALCITGNTKKYLSQWRAYNDVLCNMATWVYPAHDRNLDNLLLRRHHIELVGSSVAADMSVARLLLKPYISHAEMQAMEKAIKRQILTPFVEMAQKKRPSDWFLVAKNNWNAVCLANIVRTILAMPMQENERQLALKCAIINSRNYLSGFSQDGYCSEGLSYWSYGFGHYLRMAADLYAASQGKINIVDYPTVRMVAEFPEKLMLSHNQFFPAFSDCYFNSGISEAVLYLRNYLLKQPGIQIDKVASNMAYQLALWGLGPLPHQNFRKEEVKKISSFPLSGVYVFRHPKENGLILACKGGSNDEFHNHNDVGSYAIAFAGRLTVLGDLGSVVYTNESFSDRRYNNPVINSYGHPVPLIGGALQNAGPMTAVKVSRFVTDKDGGEVVMDLRYAYFRTPGIKKLERVFKYEFADRGKITILDSAELEEPRTFETAITTFGKINKIAHNQLLAEYAGSFISIKVESFGVPWELKHETLKANVTWRDPPQRYAVVLQGKQSNPKLKMTFTPYEKN